MAMPRKPFRTDRKDFEALVLEALRGLPRPFREKLENIEIMIEDRPSPERLEDLDIPSTRDLLGLYEGIPLTSREAFFGNYLPDRITLFKENLEYEAFSRGDLMERIRSTLLHEIGHYFGLEEDELNAIE